MGKPCGTCGASVAECGAHIREYGTGCCDACFTRDTHGLLFEQSEADWTVPVHQEISNLNRLAAQAVIARHEHAVAIRELRADVAALVEENALLRGQVAELTRERDEVDAEMEVDMIAAVLDQVSEMTEGLPGRVGELEECVAALEQKLRLRRRPVEQRT